MTGIGLIKSFPELVGRGQLLEIVLDVSAPLPKAIFSNKILSSKGREKPNTRLKRGDKHSLSIN